MDIQSEVALVKKELVELIIEHLRENKIEEEKARQLARDFLAVLPVSTYHDLLAKLKVLGETYEEAKTVYVEELERISDSQTNDALSKMRDFIKSGNMDGAIQTAKSLQEV